MARKVVELDEDERDTDKRYRSEYDESMSSANGIRSHDTADEIHSSGDGEQQQRQRKDRGKLNEIDQRAVKTKNLKATADAAAKAAHRSDS